MATATAEKVHVFEAAGLGMAPFRYIGMEYQDISYGMRNVGIKGAGGSVVTCQTKPGGTCAYCGTYIVNMFRVESADGKRFHVGCECIRKTDDSGLIQRVNDDVKKMERQKRADRKKEKTAREQAYCAEMLVSHAAKMAQLPHPTPYYSDNGKTFLDYAKWMNANNVWGSLAVMLRRMFK